MDTIISGDEVAAQTPAEDGVVYGAGGDDCETERPESTTTTTKASTPLSDQTLGQEKRNALNGHSDDTTNLQQECCCTSDEVDDEEEEEEMDRKPPAFSTIRRGTDFPQLEESKMEEEGLPTGFSLVDKEVVLVDPSIITTSCSSRVLAASLEPESSTMNKKQESVPPKITPPRAQQEKRCSIEKQPFSAGPPGIPRRSAFGSASVGAGHEDKSKFQGDFLRRHQSAGSGLPLPDYKAQVNSRSFLQVNQEDLLVDGIPEDRQEGSSTMSSAARHNASTASSSASAEGAHATVPVVAQHVITPSMARQISDATNGGSQADADIPVVSAILVPQERLEAEHRHQSEGQNSGTTMSNTDSSVDSQNRGENHGRNSNNHPSRISRSKSRSETEEPKRNERRFWISVIVLALALNSVLVTGLVVASFCAAGKCTSNSSASEIPIPSPDMYTPPTMAPTALSSRVLSSAAPTLPAMFSTGGATGDVMPPDGFLPVGGNMTEIAPVSAGTATPTPSATFAPKIPPPVSNDSGRTNGNGKAENDETTTTASPTDGLSVVGIEILLALATEVVIVGGLYLYYRWWQKRWKVLEDANSEPGSPAEEITSTCSNRSNRENRRDDVLESSPLRSSFERIDL